MSEAVALKKMCTKHPNRPAHARGLCSSCYIGLRYATNPEHKAKADAAAKAWRHANPERARAIKEKSRAKTCPVKKKDYWLRRKYGITVDDFEQLMAEQGGRCAICNQEPAEGKALHVDHCHQRGVVRGLLCAQCNWYMGKVDGDAGLLSRLVAYAEAKHD
jgi:hypothetical protein